MKNITLQDYRKQLRVLYYFRRCWRGHQQHGKSTQIRVQRMLR